MRNALSYLLGRRLKNQLLALLKSPSKLIFVILMAGIIALTLISGQTGSQGQPRRDIREFSAGVFALFAIIFAVIAKKGFDNGASMFRMQDVNLVFPSPLKPQSVLFYGLFQQLGTSLLIGFFLLFQYSWLHMLYGVDFGAVVLVFLTYGLTVFCAQLTAMAIYSFTSSNEKRKQTVKAVFYGIIIVYVAGLLLYLLADRGNAAQRLAGALNGMAFRLFPVAGWIADIANGAILQDLWRTVLGAALCIAFVAGIAVLIVKGNPDYYEDVLQSTETAHQAALDKKEGRIGESAPRRVKTGKTGIGRGEGASVFYYKHLLENRRSGMFFLNPQIIIFILVIIGFAFFMRGNGLIPVFAFATYMQIFSVAFGRLNKEILKPFVYLVPEPPFKKLMACIRESFFSSAAEAALVFIPVGFLLGLSPLETLLCIAARFSFALLFIAGNIMVGRILGSFASKALIMFVFIAILIALSMPGIAAAIIFSMSAGGFANAAMLISMTVFNIPIAFLVLFACRNMLQHTELNS